MQLWQSTSMFCTGKLLWTLQIIRLLRLVKTCCQSGLYKRLRLATLVG